MKKSLFIIIGIILGIIAVMIICKSSINSKQKEMQSQGNEEFILDEGLQDVDEYDAPEENSDRNYKNSDFGDNQKSEEKSSGLNTNDYLLPGYEQSQRSIDKIKKLRKQAQEYEQEEIERINE